MPAHADLLPRLAAKPHPARGPAIAASAAGRTPPSLITWYIGLTSHWMASRPAVQTRILLHAHQWIVERVLAPDVSLAAAAADLSRGGALTRALAGLVPPDDAGHWRQFIDLVVANLRHAILLPVTRRNEAWVRWLFLIPYSVRWVPDAWPAETPAASGA